VSWVRCPVWGNVTSRSMNHNLMIEIYNQAMLATSSTKTQSASSVSLLIPLVLLGAVFWFAIIRPQRNRQRQQQQTTAQLEPGDEIVTVGGLVATVVETIDDKVVVSVAPGAVTNQGAASQPVEMTFLRQAVARKLSAEVSPSGMDDALSASDDSGSQSEGDLGQSEGNETDSGSGEDR